MYNWPEFTFKIVSSSQLYSPNLKSPKTVKEYPFKFRFPPSNICTFFTVLSAFKVAYDEIFQSVYTYSFSLSPIKISSELYASRYTKYSVPGVVSSILTDVSLAETVFIFSL